MKNKPIKVCMLTTAFPRGKGDYAAPFVYDLCKKLVENGIKVSVVAPHDPGARKYEEMDGITVHRFQYMWPKKIQKLAYGIPHNIRTSFYAKILFPFFVLSFIFKGLKVSRDCDIIHSQWMLSGFVGSVIKKFSGKPVILTPLGSGLSFLLSFETNKRHINKFILKLMAEEIDLISTGYSKQENKLREFGFRKTEIIFMSLGVDTSKFKPEARSIELKRKLNAENDYIIINTRRFAKDYHIDTFIEAIPQITNKIRNVKFVLADSGPLQKGIEKMIDELGISEYVILMGGIPHEDMPEFLATSDIYVDTYYQQAKNITDIRKGIGQATREAMASGVPPLIPDWNPKLLANKNQFILYKTLDSKDLANKAIQLLENETLRREIGTNARQTILETSDADVITRIWVDKYGEITSRAI